MTEQKEKKEYYTIYPKDEDRKRMEDIRKENNSTEAGVLRWGIKLVHEKLFGKHE